MKKRILYYCGIISSLLLLISTNNIAQTITSTTQGGEWGSSATWIGGIVPGLNNDVVINATVSVSVGVTVRSITISDTGALQNAYNTRPTVTTTSFFINNGIIQVIPGYYSGFYLATSGNITNNGIWAPQWTTFTGPNTKEISSANGKRFQGNFQSMDSACTIKAKTAILFANPFNLNKGTLDMQSFALTLAGGGYITNGKVVNTQDLILVEGASLATITFLGHPNLRGLVQVNSYDVVMEGTVTITDSLQNSYNSHPTLTINGSIINNGVIRVEPGYYSGFKLLTSGNITNNGIWSPQFTTFTGSDTKEISSASGKRFQGNFQNIDPACTLKAKTSLLFANPFDMSKGTFDAQSFALTFAGGGYLTNGRVINTKDLILIEGAILNAITYAGDINLRGKVQVNAYEVYMEGSVTVTDTLQNNYNSHPTLTIKGPLVNNGVIRIEPGYYSNFAVDVSGDITNNNIWSIGATRLSGTGKRTVLAKGIQGPIQATGTNVSLTGANILPRLTVLEGAYCEVAGDGTLQFLESIATGKFVNKGKIIIVTAIKTPGDYSFFGIQTKYISITGVDTLTIESYGNQVPFSFANAVKKWWRVKPVPNKVQSTFSSLTLFYNESELGNNNESTLQVFYSSDSSKTWKQLSTSMNVTRNTTSNYLTINDVPGEGDYLLSSSADPTSVSPSIITAVIGSSNIRVGAPVRLTIHYVNNSDLAAPDFLISINTGSKVHIKSVEVPMATGGYMSFPKDSLFWDNEDTTLIMYALKMAPREERTFDIIVIGDKPTLSKPLFIDPVSITAAAVVTWVAWKAGTAVVCAGIDYLGDKAIKGIKMSPSDQERYDRMVKGGVPTVLEQRKGGFRSFSEKVVATQLIKQTVALTLPGETAVSVAHTVNENVKLIAPTLRQRIFNWFYKETGLYGVETTENGNTYQPQVSNVTQKNGKLVTSWDPNEKAGPNGYGAQQFISTAGKMTYNILFENKKEASAPAYKIVIYDTLRSEFDPETVEFGRKSHEGPQYNWNITRTGNILKWEIEGIELPPNVVPPEGEGWVSYTVSPKKSLASGVDLKNRATIVFDLNQPITTNEYSNRLDFTPPTTVMSQLSPAVTNDKITVRWISNDGINGSGVESAILYMSVDNGPFNLVGVSNSDSLIINALSGTHNYAFYALANDYVGNVETVHPTPNSTQIINSVDYGNEGIPTTYSLSQNYPNPFNPLTNIQYSIKESGRIELAVFNILGQKVKTLVDEFKNAGSYSAIFDASKLASGIYIYRIKVNNFIDSKKLILLK